MKIFVDTNVILENFLQRENYNVTHRLFDLLKKQEHVLIMSSGSFYTMVFLVDKYLKRERGMSGEVRLMALRQIMSGILKDIRVAEHDNESLLCGLNNPQFKDIEDGCQYELAKKAACELLLTFNTSDYPTNTELGVMVLSPSEYINTYL
jgi:predicted nucleic acid-binding protein